MAGGRKTPKWERNRVTGSGDGGKSEGCRGERQGCKEETRDAGGEPGMGGGGGGQGCRVASSCLWVSVVSRADNCNGQKPASALALCKRECG